jgi:hypothetical protein
VKEIKKDTKMWKDIPCSCIRRMNIAKISLLPKAIYRFNIIPTKTPVSLFAELEKRILQLIWNHRIT